MLSMNRNIFRCRYKVITMMKRSSNQCSGSPPSPMKLYGSRISTSSSSPRWICVHVVNDTHNDSKDGIDGMYRLFFFCYILAFVIYVNSLSSHSWMCPHWHPRVPLSLFQVQDDSDVLWTTLTWFISVCEEAGRSPRGTLLRLLRGFNRHLVWHYILENWSCSQIHCLADR